MTARPASGAVESVGNFFYVKGAGHPSRRGGLRRLIQYTTDSHYSATGMTQDQPNNPLHGKTLEMILTHLVNTYGWRELGSLITIRCFNENPSITSSLKFLRTTPWARKKVEDLYINSID